MGFLTALARISLDMSVVTFLILWMPGMPPHTTFTEFDFPPSPSWSGSLERNDKLNIVDRLFENQIKGPESFAIKDGFIYTGLMSGVIAKIDTDDLSIVPVARIGEECAGQHEDYKCGRPLGLTFTSEGKLLVSDAVLGLYLLDLDRKDENEGRITSYKHFDRVSYEQLINPETIVDGAPNILLNAVVIAKDNRTVYLTVSSTRFPLRDSLFELLSDPSGRIIKFDLETRKIEVLVEEINFANGIELSTGEDYLLITETGRPRIHKYHLKGEKAGSCEVLIDSLPGLPDNIKLNDRGNYYVGLSGSRLPNTWHILEVLAPHNILRKFISRLVSMVLVPAKFVNKILPTEVLQMFEYWCANLEPIAHLTPPYGLVIEINGENGEVMSSLHSTNGAVRFISEAVVLDRWIYLGSPYTNYLARVPKRLRDATSVSSVSGVSLGYVDEEEDQSENNESEEVIEVDSESEHENPSDSEHENPPKYEL